MPNSNDKKDLDIEENSEIVPIQSVCSGLTRCCRCGVELTKDNDSGWEVFVTATRTAPICKECNKDKCYSCGAKDEHGSFNLYIISDDQAIMLCESCAKIQKSGESSCRA